MKHGARPGYVLRQSWLLLEQSPWLSAVSALTVALALTLVGLLAMTLFNANRLLHELGRQMTVSIYLQESTSEADIEALTRKVSARPGVKRVRTLTAVQDRERNKKLLDPALLAGLDEAAIPGQPVLQVELEESLGSRGEVEQLAVWTQSLKSVAAVDSAEFGADKLRVLFAGVEIARPVGLLLSVVDTGIGIPADQIARVFEPFRQVDRKKYGKSEGTGLGLSICKGLLEPHGATITLTSAVGQGTTATVHFPAERTLRRPLTVAAR